MAALASMLWLTVTVALSLGFVRGEGSGRTLIAFLSAAGCLALVVALRVYPRPRVAWRLSLCFAAGLIWLVGVLYGITFGFELRPLAILQLALLAVWLWVGLITDSLVLYKRPVSDAAVALAAVSTTAVVVSGYWSVTAAMHSSVGHVATYSRSFLALVLVCIVNAALIWTTGATLVSTSPTAAAGPASPVYDPLWILTGTQLYAAAAFVVLIWFPALVLAHVPAQTSERWTRVAIILGGLMLFLSPIFFWALRSQSRHIAFESHLRLKVPQRQHVGLLSRPVGRSVIAAIHTSSGMSPGPITTRERVGKRIERSDQH